MNFLTKQTALVVVVMIVFVMVNNLLSQNNVGINTLTPTHKLDVNGEARIRTINDTNNITGVLTHRADGVIQNIPYDTLLNKIQDSSEWIDGAKVGLTPGAIYARKALANGDTITLNNNGTLGINTNTLSNNSGRLVVKSKSIHGGGTNFYRHFVVNDSSNVIIGGSGQPGFDFRNIPADLFINHENEDGKTARLVFQSNGAYGAGYQVGIGSTMGRIAFWGPDSQVPRIGNNREAAKIEATSSTTWAGANSVTGNLIFYTSDSSDNAPSQERMIISHNGNVGVGITTPQRTVHIKDVMRLEPSTTPTAPSAGDVYFDSTTNKLRCYDGTVWQDLF